VASRDWAKTKVTCAVCNGSHDGTPSGLRKHELTLKHITAGRLSAEPADIARVEEALTPDEIVNMPLDADKVSADLQPSGDKVKVAVYVVVEVDIDALARHMGYGFTKREAITAVRQSLYVAATQAAYPEGIVTPISDNR
jgi:hypothetical protein